MQVLAIASGNRAHRAARSRPWLEVWQLSLRAGDRAVEAAASVLTPAERERADRGTDDVRRRRIVLRAALRWALGRVLSCPPADVPLVSTPWGRPEAALRTTSGSRWHPLVDANCSASGDVGLVVVGHGTRVGIDIERVLPWTPATRDEGWLTAREVAALADVAPDGRAVAATQAWTVKEAVLKAEGSGLSRPPAQVEAGIGPAPARRVGGWHVRGVVVPPGLVATLASSGPATAGRRAVIPRLLTHRHPTDEDRRP